MKSLGLDIAMLMIPLTWLVAVVQELNVIKAPVSSNNNRRN